MTGNEGSGGGMWAGMVNAYEVKNESGRRIPPILPQLLSAVVDTGGKFAAGVVDTGGEP